MKAYVHSLYELSHKKSFNTEKRMDSRAGRETRVHCASNPQFTDGRVFSALYNLTQVERGRFEVLTFCFFSYLSLKKHNTHTFWRQFRNMIASGKNVL